jgi:uncharacterized RDD family membrane protein YckC
MQQRNPYEPPQASLIAVEVAPGDGRVHLRYAGFWRRFSAFWLDALFLLPLTGIAYYIGEKTRLFHLYWFVPGLLVGLWFHVYLVRRYGGTPGKLLLKTRVAMVDGSPPTFQAAALRYAVPFVLSAFVSGALLRASLAMTDELYFSLGYLARNRMLVELASPWYRIASVLLVVWVWGEFLSLLFNKKRRAIDDFIAGTVVVHVTPSV